MKSWKDTLTFLKNRPNKLVAYFFFLSFLLLLYWFSKAEMIIYMGIGAAVGLFPSFLNE